MFMALCFGKPKVVMSMLKLEICLNTMGVNTMGVKK
jgi:hypothetical protein